MSRVPSLFLSSGLINIRSIGFILNITIIFFPIGFYIRKIAKKAYYSEEYFLENKFKLQIIGFFCLFWPGIKISLGGYKNSN